MRSKKKYFTALKSFSLFCLLIFFILISVNCSDSTSLPSPSQFGVLSGQVNNLSHPGPIPVGWTPPPLDTVSTIIVLDNQRKIILETSSDKKGKFQLMLPSGTYYLRVKESPIPAETGPYFLNEGQTVLVEAHYDNGMR